MVEKSKRVDGPCGMKGYKNKEYTEENIQNNRTE